MSDLSTVIQRGASEGTAIPSVLDPDSALSHAMSLWWALVEWLPE